MKLSDKVVLITYWIDLLRPEGPKKIYFKTPPPPPLSQGLDDHFLGPYEKFSLVLLQITNYIFSP